MRRARGRTALDISAEPPRIASFRSTIRTEEVHHGEPNYIGSQWRGIAAELRKWARGCHSTEAAVELLIRARGGRFVEPGQPWLSTDDRGITWLDAQLVRQYAHAVSSGERHILALVESLALGGPHEDVGGLMASLDPYHLDLVFASLRHASCGSGAWRRVDGSGVDHEDDRRRWAAQDQLTPGT
jgi:hypothetical protein